MNASPDTILGIDTTLMAMSAAVIRGRKILSNQTVPDVRDQAERLPGLIANVTDEANIVLSDINKIAVTVGPGGFSGVRVGLSHARGMAAVLGCPVIGIGTLEALAAGVATERPVIAAIDARRGEIYIQAFEADLVPRFMPRALTPGDAAKTYGSLDAIVVGTGRHLFLDALASEHCCTDGHRDFPDPADIAKCAIERSMADAQPNPLYIRPPDAKLPSSSSLRVHP